MWYLQEVTTFDRLGMQRGYQLSDFEQDALNLETLLTSFLCSFDDHTYSNCYSRTYTALIFSCRKLQRRTESSGCHHCGTVSAKREASV